MNCETLCFVFKKWWLHARQKKDQLVFNYEALKIMTWDFSKIHLPLESKFSIQKIK